VHFVGLFFLQYCFSFTKTEQLVIFKVLIVFFSENQKETHNKHTVSIIYRLS